MIQNPFPDIVPRITQQEREAQELARVKLQNNAPRIPGGHKKGKKNTSLLSFGDEEDVPAGPRRKGISSHDLLYDTKLSKNTLPLVQEVPVRQPQKEKLPSSFTQEPSQCEDNDSEINTLEDHIRRGFHTSVQNTKPKSHGRSMLASITEQYRNKPKKKERDTLARLDDFKRNIRDMPSRQKRPRVEYARSLMDDEHARGYGASDDEDANWRSHRCVLFLADKL